MRLSRIEKAIKNPSKTIQYLFGGKEAKKKVISSFIKDYNLDLRPLEVISSFFNIDVKPYYDELLSDNYYNQLENTLIKNWGKDFWLFGFAEARMLYIITRILRPKIIIETGVASGLSSFMFLLALNKNSQGKLFSIDLPPNDQHFPTNKKQGWLVPDSLKECWTVKIGDAKKILPSILNELHECDLFLHDSEHSYKHMTWEFETVWPYLKKLLLTDDIYQNNAFDDFVDRHKISKKSKISKRFGIILVPDAN